MHNIASAHDSSLFPVSEKLTFVKRPIFDSLEILVRCSHPVSGEHYCTNVCVLSAYTYRIAGNFRG